MGKRIALVLLASVSLMNIEAASHLTLNLNGVGNLKELLLDSDIEGLESLKIVGEMKAPDWKYLASNTGIISYVKELDLSEAKISYDGEVYASESISTGSMGVVNTYEYHFWSRDSVATRQTLQGPVYEYWGNNLAGAFRGTSYEKIVVPKTIHGIGLNAFKNCANLQEVVLCGSEKFIGEAAFYNSGTLSRLELPESVDSIAMSAFYKSGKGLELDLSHVSKICGSAFKESGVTVVILPASMSELPAQCFSGCKQLRSITTGGSMKAIGDDAFYGCEALESVTLSEGLEKIGESAFYGCVTLSESRFPESVRVIGDKAFKGCKKLQSVTIPLGLEELGSDSFENTPYSASLKSENGILYIGHIAYSPAQDMKSDVEIKEGTRVLANKLFNYHRLNGEWSQDILKSVKLPSTLNFIGSEAFRYCKLQEISLPEGLVKIGDGCFMNVNFASIDLPSSLKIIGEEAFANDSGDPQLRAIKFPDGLEEIGTGAFKRQPLMSVTLPAGLKVLGSGAFAYNKNLVSVEYKCRDVICTYDHYTTGPFYDSSCDRLTFSDGVESIPSCLFYGSHLGVSSIVLPEGVRTIGDRAFNECDAIKSITLPSTLERIGAYALSSTCIASVDFGDNLSYIGDGAFYNTKIEELTLPEGLEYLGDEAFGNINCLKTVNFNCCHAVSKDEIYGSQFGPSRRLGVPFKSSTCEILNIGPEVRYLMPNFMAGEWGNRKNIKSVDLSKIGYIGESAFEYTALESVVLPDVMEEIPTHLFYECYNLSEVKMPVSCKRIGTGSFSGCFSLNPCRLLPEDVEEIGIGAFLRCRGADYDAERNRWESLILPSSIRRVEDRAFSGCSGVNTAFIPSTVEYLGESSLAFAEEYGTYKKVIMMRNTPIADSLTPFDKSSDAKQSKWTAIVPNGSKRFYSNQAGWSALNIEEMCEFVVDSENVFNVNFNDLRVSDDEYNSEMKSTDGTIIGGVYYSLPYLMVNRGVDEESTFMTFWEGCSDENVAKLHGARIDTHYIYDFFNGFGVMLPAVKGCIEMDAQLNGRKLNLLIDGQDVISVSEADRTRQIIDFDLLEPTLAWFYLSKQENRVGADIYKLAIHPNRNVNGIDSVNQDGATEVVGRYDINGRIVTGDQRGVIIERLSDGSTRKVIR